MLIELANDVEGYVHARNVKNAYIRLHFWFRLSSFSQKQNQCEEAQGCSFLLVTEF